MFSTTPCSIGLGRQPAIVGGTPAPSDCRQCQTARCVIARAKNSQKNQGLYFEYEKVDPEAHKQVPAQKERIQEEFGWVKRARTGPTYSSQQYTKHNRFDKNRSNQRRSASRSTTGAAAAAEQEQTVPDLQPAPQRSTSTDAIQPESASQPSQSAPESSQEPQATVQQSNVGINNGNNNDGSNAEQTIVRSRKQMLLERMNASKPGPTTGEPATTQAAISDASTSSEQSTQSPVLSQGAATAATAATAAAAAAAAVLTASSSQSTQPSQAQPAAAGSANAPSSSNESESLALPPVPPVNDPNNTDEQKVRALLQGMLQLTETDMAQLDDIDFSALASQQNAADNEFSSWLSGVRNSTQTQGQQPSANGAASYLSENEDELKQAAEAQASVSALLASAGRDFADIQSLYKQLNEDDDAFSESLGPDIPEDQLLSSLKATSPELFKLLSPGDGLDYTEEDEELEKALASFSRLGFDRDNDDNGAASLLDVDTSLPKGVDDASMEMLLGESDIANKASKQDGQNDDEDDELITDEELAVLARQDPDLAALLQADNLGKNFEKLMNKAEGLDEDDEDAGVGNDQDAEGVEFSELFDAIDEEEELDDEDKARAKFELQSMFNAPSKRDQDTTSQPLPPRGPTTTGVAGLPKDAVPELKSRPKLG